MSLQTLEKAIEKKTPYISGTVALAAESTKLFFCGTEVPGYVDLATPTSDQLSSLVNSCQPASFGRNKEDVLDESYRKAGKLDASHFGINLDLTRLGLLEKISRFLLVEDRPIRAELYKLNVYGPGSFFKSHKDTPRDATMFGSLVLVLPIPHEGGELVLRVDGQEMRYDSSAILAQQDKPSVGYIAFYGDIEHEVLPVTSGNRVTLTYNLFFAAQSDPSIGMTPILQQPFMIALKDLLRNPDFLPQGGTLGYGLKYQYPVSVEEPDLRVVAQNLKGEDALVARVSSSLNLSTAVKVIYSKETYNGYSHHIALDYVPDLGFDELEDVYQDLRNQRGAIEVRWKNGDKGYLRRALSDEERFEEIHWFTEPRFNGPKISYVAYGNEATLGCDYGCCCLFIKVQSYEARKQTAMA